MPYTHEMAVDEQSSQDSTLIDEDLVAALGFEPVSTIEVTNGDAAEAVLDDVVVVDDDAIEVVDTPVDEVSTNGDFDGFGIDEVDDQVTDVAEVEALVDDSPVDVDVVDEPDVDDITVDEVDVADVDTEDVLAIADVDVADVDVLDVDAADVDVENAVDELADNDLAAVPSISDDVDVDATAPVDLVDLDLDTLEVSGLEVSDVDVSDVAVALDDADVSDVEVSDHEATDLEETGIEEIEPDLADLGTSDDVIDLDTVDLSDSPVEAEVHALADADSVFADATPVLDPPGFDDPIGLPATETVGQADTGLLDLDSPADTAGAAAVATAATATATKGRRRLRARKSRRVIRHIDPWSVLTFSVLFHMVVFAALLLSSVLVWNAAIASGMVENVESFIQELGDYETFEINADVMFRAAIVIAGMLTLASSVLVVLLTVVFNLISDLVGGIRVTVIEEETVRVPIEKKRSKARNE